MKWLGRGLFVAALLMIIFTTAWKQLGMLLREVTVATVVAALVFLLVIDLLRALKMAMMSINSDSFMKRVQWCYLYNLASGYYALALPGFVFGGGVRWLYYRKIFGGNSAAWMVIVDNYTQFFSVFMLAVPALFVLFDTKVPGVFAFGMLGAMGAVPIILRQVRLSRFVTFKNTRVRSVVTFVDEKIAAAGTGYRRVSALLVCSLMYQVLLVVFVEVLTMAIGVRIDWWIIVFAITGLTIVQLIPGVMGGIGIREASLCGMLIPFGIAREEAMVLGLLITIVTIARGLIGALAVLTMKRKT